MATHTNGHALDPGARIPRAESPVWSRQRRFSKNSKPTTKARSNTNTMLPTVSSTSSSLYFVIHTSFLTLSHFSMSRRDRWLGQLNWYRGHYLLHTWNFKRMRWACVNSSAQPYSGSASACPSSAGLHPHCRSRSECRDQAGAGTKAVLQLRL